MNRKQARRWFVAGTVQGVGFRIFVQRTAASLGVSGWARNVADGRVEVYGVGTSDRLNDLASALHLGPRMAEVRSVEEHEDEIESVSGFSVR